MLGQLFQKKEHVSYKLREKTDKQVEYLKPKIFGDVDKKIRMEEEQNKKYMIEKIKRDQEEDDRRKKHLKKKEVDTINYLQL
jgi:hypothetical protein